VYNKFYIKGLSTGLW